MAADKSRTKSATETRGKHDKSRSAADKRRYNTDKPQIFYFAFADATYMVTVLPTRALALGSCSPAICPRIFIYCCRGGNRGSNARNRGCGAAGRGTGDDQAHPAGRPVSVRARWRVFRKLRAAAAASQPRLLSRVHGEDARREEPRRAADRGRPRRRALLHS